MVYFYERGKCAWRRGQRYFCGVKKYKVTLWKIPTFGKFKTFQKLISKQFSNLFSSYTQAFNKRYERKGSLFMPNFKRKEITSESYLTAVVAYIHRNPIHHGFCTSLHEWKFSSYNAYIHEKSTKIQKDYILKWFNGKNEFISFHKEHHSLTDNLLFIDFWGICKCDDFFSQSKKLKFIAYFGFKYQ